MSTSTSLLATADTRRRAVLTLCLDRSIKDWIAALAAGATRARLPPQTPGDHAKSPSTMAQATWCEPKCRPTNASTPRCKRKCRPTNTPTPRANANVGRQTRQHRGLELWLPISRCRHRGANAMVGRQTRVRTGDWSRGSRFRGVGTGGSARDHVARGDRPLNSRQRRDAACFYFDR